ncbi:MAG TPA: hypothetical protein VIZ32_08315, partial [Vicinamibacterales bacterium]
VVLYESATGQRTFSRPTTVETLNAILKEDPPELPATVPMGLRQIIAHCLEKEPGRRFQTAADVAFALRSFGSTTTVSAPLEVETAPVRGRTKLYSATAALVLAALAAGTYAGARWFQETPLDLSAVRLEPFAVESESESHPAISPDGRSVAYVRGVGVPNVGDIVVKSDSASAPVVLVRNVAVPYNLFWSRTGDRLYFTSGRRLRSVATIGGDARDELLDVNGGHLSPDGRTFATFKIDGTGQVQFVVGPREALRPYDPPMHGPMACFPSFVRFSPDGSKILLRTTCPENALYVLPVPSADGKGPAPRQLFNGKLDANVGAQWYADSRHIVFASHGSLWLGDSETEVLTRLTTSATPAHWPDVGHDGTIAFAEDILDHDVIELPLAGGAPRVLVSSALYDGAAAWAPTTGTFAYVANRGAGDEIRLRSIVDGSEQRLLSLRDFPDAPGDTTQVVRGLTYSPDGQWLAAAVMSLHPSVQAGIWIVPANGGTPRRTTSKDANALQASWSPDGKSMAIQMWDDRLSIVGIGSGEARGVATPAPAVFRHLEWSPTGEWIAASWWRPGTPPTAVLIDPTTGAVRELKEFSAPPAYAWAPDGKTVYGVFLTDTGSELRALDVASGRVRAVAKYTTRLRIEDEIIHSLRMVFDARRQSFITTVANDRSNVWLLRGLSLSVPSAR